MAFLPKLPSISAATPLVLRAGIRFWTFDQTRHLLAPLHLPVWLIGGLGGAAGGFNEVLLHSLVQSRKLPSATALGAQTLRLFLCFGTFTYLSTSFSDTLPPKPFWKCWLMGATAGATGSAIVAALEGTSGTALWGRAIPRGAATIGTVIAVHVTSCSNNYSMELKSSIVHLRFAFKMQENGMKRPFLFQFPDTIQDLTEEVLQLPKLEYRVIEYTASGPRQWA
ncbi:hypothetical protein E4T38_09154 [Aureobasidium subglaciale]|nr:hypothetical protein E4T38_09154 [Aureobasidium subglaciale]KAI5214368.1 hypothetical protein E4T40_09058 [Aureobasidium subglaciale]KAI5216958.1 hypothetical protein E4T41_09060 [Aureobasidium subglaciale]KAI5253216.1 hypothetical protein E4T46_09678 [Aureobasidium subglaciale]